MDRQGTYLLNRSTFSSIRLTAQHFLWHDHLGWNLHPGATAATDNPPLKPHRDNADGNSDGIADSTSPRSLAVADVACGNGIWLMQESQSSAYPPGTTFHGFDISDTQFPSPAITPTNLTFSILDASLSSHIPAEYQNAFDIVHIRLLMGAIQATPYHFLQSFLTLLRPGGFLQWDEVNTHDCQPFPLLSTPCKYSGYLTRLIASCQPSLNMPMTWLKSLPALFEDEGMIDVEQLRGGPPKPEMRRYWTDNEFGVMTEIASGMGAPREVFEELEQDWKRRQQEIAWEVVVTTGRKSLN